MSRTKKRPYRKSRAVDPSCRSHGGCPYCAQNRSHKHRKQEGKSIVDNSEQCQTIPAVRLSAASARL